MARHHRDPEGIALGAPPLIGWRGVSVPPTGRVGPLDDRLKAAHAQPKIDQPHTPRSDRSANGVYVPAISR